MADLSLTPIIALPLLLLLLAVVVVVMTWSFRFGLRSRGRSVLLWGLRLAALAAMLVVMLQPQQRHDE
ncbi:MAG: hypothetical protein FJ388_12420, partial [Verrucomicrobia bacterium]|nr:hypothetical protein [Verrucomicrobiota bacterium]